MKIIQHPSVPTAVGPYSQAIVADGRVYTSGQIALDPATGEMVTGGVDVEARRALTNLKALLAASGSSMDRVIKTTVFLVDMADFPAMNAVYAEFFGDWKPARSTVAVAALPKGARFECEAVALVG